MVLAALSFWYVGGPVIPFASGSKNVVKQMLTMPAQKQHELEAYLDAKFVVGPKLWDPKKKEEIPLPGVRG